MSVIRFYDALKEPNKLTASDLIDLFAYYLTVEAGQESFSAQQINKCFNECDLRHPANTAPYLSTYLKGTAPKFVKADPGYRLHRVFKDTLSKRLGSERTITQVSSELRALEARFPNGDEKQFLKETIDCYEVGANRAAIVMCWILVMDHMFEYVLKHHLTAFNSVLGRNTERRIRISAITTRDDFSEIPEGKFVEFLRSASIISNDVRKILDEKLGVRNSSAHPSGITIRATKVVGFVEDLIDNVVLKYPL